MAQSLNHPIFNPLYATSLGWAASIMWNGCYVGDRLHAQTAALDGTDCGFATRPWALYKYVHFLHAVFSGRAICVLGGNARRKWRAFAVALEPCCAGATPANCSTAFVADCNDRVIEAGENMHLSKRHIFARSARVGLASNRSILCGSSHSVLKTPRQLHTHVGTRISLLPYI